MMMRKISLSALALCLAASLSAQSYKTKNVVIVTLDGLRWQEIFRGADSALVNSAYTEDKEATYKQFGAASADERRKLLFPFLWSTLAAKGQLYGNRDEGSHDEVVNKYFFSYPGYSEIFTGFADPKLNTNNAVTNPNTNVLEFLNKQRGFEKKVAVFSSWERFPQILNVNRSGLMVNAGYMNMASAGMNERIIYLNDLQHKAPHYLGDSTRLDFLTCAFASEYLTQYKPRVLCIALDETDEMGHKGNYQYYLDRAHQADAYLQQLWERLQTDPVYKNNTTLIITCDHGRGDIPIATWRNHNAFIPHSNQTWLAVIGPDTPPMGEVRSATITYHKQLAQTIALLLGFDFKAAAGHEVGEPIWSILEGTRFNAAIAGRQVR